MKYLIPVERVQQRIFLIRGHKVMLDKDLAILYGIKPIALRQQIRRNSERFPDDFMFQLRMDEAVTLVSQSVIASVRRLGGSLPLVFTQEGVAMLSSVLRSKRAIQVNVAIMRAFVQLRHLISSDRQLAKKVARHEKKIRGLTTDVQQIFELINPLLDGPIKKIDLIGFK